MQQAYFVRKFNFSSYFIIRINYTTTNLAQGFWSFPRLTWSILYMLRAGGGALKGNHHLKLINQLEFLRAYIKM